MTGTSHQQLSPSTEQVSCLKKQTAARVVKNVSAFYGTRKFITLFTTVRHWALISTDIIQSRPSQPICIRPMLVISSHIHLAIPESPFPIVYYILRGVSLSCLRAGQLYRIDSLHPSGYLVTAAMIRIIKKYNLSISTIKGTVCVSPP